MTVLQKTLASGRPDNNAVISATSGKLLAILLIGDAVHSVSVPSDLLDHLPCVRIINENAVSHSNQDLSTIYRQKGVKGIVVYQAYSKLPKLSWSCLTLMVEQARHFYFKEYLTMTSCHNGRVRIFENFKNQLFKLNLLKNYYLL